MNTRKTHNRARLAFVVVVVAVAAMLVHFWTSPQRNQLIVAEMSQPAAALYLVAQHQGYFETENLEIVSQKFPLGRLALQAVINDEADLALAYDTPVIQQAIEGVPLVALAALHRSNENTAILARSDRGIHSPRDLAHKRIGVTQRTNADFMAHSFLLDQGVGSHLVQFRDLAPEELVEAITSGSVDAIAVWQPLLNTAIEALGEKNSTVLFSDSYSETSLVVGKRSVLQKQQALSAFLRGLVKADAFLIERPDEAREIVDRELARRGVTGTKEIWNRFQFRVQMSHLLLVLLQQQADWFADFRRSSSVDTNVRRLLHTQLLERIHPEAVTLLRQPGSDP